jgi:hypothetical protein
LAQGGADMQKWHFGLLIFIIFIGSKIFAQTVESGFDEQTNLDNRLRLFCNRETAYSSGVSDARKGLARKQEFAQVCKTNRADLDGAYNSGYNFGLTNQSGLVVNEPAPSHPEVQSQLPSSYVQPYTRPVEVVSNPNYAPNPNVTTSPGSPITATSSTEQASRTPNFPGLRAVPSGDLARPEPVQGLQTLTEIEPSAQPKCIRTSTGIACGFNCVNSMNNVRCASQPDQICRSNPLGIIACGYHCISTVKTVRCALYSSDVCVADSNGNVFCGINCRVERNAIAVCDVERYAP